MNDIDNYIDKYNIDSFFHENFTKELIKKECRESIQNELEYIRRRYPTMEPADQYRNAVDEVTAIISRKVDRIWWENYHIQGELDWVRAHEYLEELKREDSEK